jgi:hypothetical protein
MSSSLFVSSPLGVVAPLLLELEHAAPTAIVAVITPSKKIFRMTGDIARGVPS